jgi:hypothetical protein
VTELEPQFLEVVSTSAAELRQAFMPFQAGVMDSGDLKVTAGGGTREISVAAGVGFVAGSATDQGLYRIRNDAAKSSLAFDTPGLVANSSGNPRLDQIIARILDHTFDGSGLRKWRLEYATGTPNAATTIDTRTGAVSDVSLGSNWCRLADVIVPNGATTILAANVRDRRPWARGAWNYIERTAGNYTTTSATNSLIDSTNLQPRIECSGLPLTMELFAKVSHSVAAAAVGFTPFMDGAAIGTVTDARPVHIAAAGGSAIVAAVWNLTPSKGSHTFGWAWFTSGATATLSANTLQPLQMRVMEHFRQNANNT